MRCSTHIGIGLLILLILLLIILVPVGVLVVGKKGKSGAEGAAASTTTVNSGANLKGVPPSSIPTEAKGTYLDPFTWYDTTGFNVTYTNETVGDLPIMGLNSTWDDSRRANSRTPRLDEPWPYGKRPIRGVNLGGWLSLEPFITPSLFSGYDAKLGVVDEYTLTRHLGPTAAAARLERHYATFVTERTFAEIAAAGLDHVRIPFPYWAVATYADEPFVPRIAWRYLLRGIEWARAHGLRVKLDVHALPGSQNGWNHSGRLGSIGWLNATADPEGVNARRSLELHDRLSRFFAQPRYARVVAIYGLVNEPRMTLLPADAVHRWNADALRLVRANGVRALVAIGDGFLGLQKWQGNALAAADSGVVLDVHQYIIFNIDQLGLPHRGKIEFTCNTWGEQMSKSVNTATG